MPVSCQSHNIVYKAITPHMLIADDERQKPLTTIWQMNFKYTPASSKRRLSE